MNRITLSIVARNRETLNWSFHALILKAKLYTKTHSSLSCIKHCKKRTILVKDFFSKCDQIRKKQFLADLVTFRVRLHVSDMKFMPAWKKFTLHACFISGLNSCRHEIRFAHNFIAYDFVKKNFELCCFLF